LEQFHTNFSARHYLWRSYLRIHIMCGVFNTSEAKKNSGPGREITQAEFFDLHGAAIMISGWLATFVLFGMERIFTCQRSTKSHALAADHLGCARVFIIFKHLRAREHSTPSASAARRDGCPLMRF
jgi:hypothetical protein